jgi:predicted secreted protein
MAKSKSKQELILCIVLISLLFLAWDIGTVNSATAPSVLWTHSFGGKQTDRAYCVIQTDDGGYALAGSTNSFGVGGADLWIVKTDSSGNMDWNKTYGGPNDEIASAIMQTEDGGFVIAGMTSSFGAGGFDYWLVKTDSQGNMQWNKTYGGAQDDFAISVIKTSDSGYALAGWTNSFGAGGEDLWLVKTDSSGNMMWNRTYGGQFDDEAHALIQTGDGGYAIAGDTSFANGNEDAWLVKTDSNGIMQWNQTYGGAKLDTILSIVQLSDGTYALAGYTLSFGEGLSNAWLLKTDSSGNILWNKTYGGTYDNHAYSMMHTSDGGFILAGDTKTSIDAPSNYLVIKTDSSGNMEWERANGASTDNVAYSIIQSSDNGFVLVGTTDAGGNGDDALLVKLGGNSNIMQLPLLPIVVLFVVVLIVVLVVVLLSHKRKKGTVPNQTNRI